MKIYLVAELRVIMSGRRFHSPSSGSRDSRRADGWVIPNKESVMYNLPGPRAGPTFFCMKLCTGRSILYFKTHLLLTYFLRKAFLTVSFNSLLQLFYVLRIVFFLIGLDFESDPKDFFEAGSRKKSFQIRTVGLLYISI